jgi:hypothetical protein
MRPYLLCIRSLRLQPLVGLTSLRASALSAVEHLNTLAKRASDRELCLAHLRRVKRKFQLMTSYEKPKPKFRPSSYNPDTENSSLQEGMMPKGISVSEALVRRATPHWGRLTLLAAIVFAFSLTGWGQDQATLVGAVTDPSGAAIPGAKVRVSQPNVGFARELVSNSAGEYIAARIPIGVYVITVEATGFQKLVRSGITLEVGQELRVDLQLTLGQATQEISVSGNVAKVETENATVSDVVTGKQIQDLNLNGRNYQALTILTPGAAPDNSMDVSHLGHNASAYISFNGTRTYYNNFEVEGGQNEDSSSGGDSPDTFPALDSIAEFRINTSNYGADVGMRAGANIQVITKSGSRQFHGSAAEFVRNDAMDANDWFANRQIAPPGGNAPKTPLKWNLPGYTFGGPFYIPGHYNTDKSKTFFFWSQSWARYREGTVITPNAPTMRMRQGDFSECDPASANYNTIAASGCIVPINPATGTAFPGDMVPIDPNAKDMLNGLVPLANNGIIGYVAAPSVPTNWRQEQIRVDQNVSEKTTIFARYTQDAWAQTLVPALWTASSYDTVATPWQVPAKNAVLHLTHTFRPTLMNEFILAYGDDVHHIIATPGPGNVAGSILKPANWSVNPIFPANKAINVLPGLSVSGGTPFSFDEDSSTNVNYNTALPTVTFKDNVIYNVGRQTLKFGVFYMIYHDYGPFNYYDPQGSFTFTGGGPITTGNALADMYLGRIQSYVEGTPYNYNTGVATGGFGEEHGRWKQFESYFQDDWKVNKRLTLNLGMRYTWNVPVYFANTNPNINTNFIPSQYSVNNAPQIDANGNLIPGSGQFPTSPGNGIVVCGTGGIPLSCIHPDRFTWQPRFGFAFDPTGSGKTSIRGGLGIYHDANAGFEASGEEILGGPPAVLAPVATNILGYQSIVSGPLAPPSFGAIPTRAVIPTVSQYNVTVQHEFSGNNLLSLAWVGSLGRHLGASRNINQVPDGAGTANVPALAGTPGCDASGNCDVQNVLINQYDPSIYFVPYRGFSSIKYLQYSEVSNYNSLQVNFRHTIGYGMTFQSAYTYSHAIDNGTAYLANYGVDDSNLSRWRATGDYNRTHVLVLNYVYELPFFRHASNSFLRTGAGGWKVSGITSFFSGEPVNISCGKTGYSNGVGRGLQCNTLGPLKIQKGVTDDPQFGSTPTWFNTAVIAQPLLSQYYSNGEPGMFGYEGRNVLTGPGRNNWDIALLKDFQTPWFKGEHSSLQFRLETYNTFNHPQWKYINASCGGETPFGATCTGIANNYQNGEVTGAWLPRNVQLGMKLSF